MKKHLFAFGMVAVWGLVGFANQSRAAILLNEFFVNIPSTAGSDNGAEFFELRSTTGGAEALTGMTLLVLEGDGTGGGLVDVALDLSSFSTGTNGLFLWRDSAAVVSPAPAAGTTVNVADFSPDLENGSTTFVLVQGWTGTVGTTDIDSDNNGTVDGVLPWSSVVDAIGWVETDAGTNLAYGAQLGGTQFPLLGFTPDMAFRLRDTQGWVGSDVTGSSITGPFGYDPVQAARADGSAIDPATFDISTLTPGNVNPQLVPEPATGIVAGLGLIGLIGLARRRGHCRNRLA